MNQENKKLEQKINKLEKEISELKNNHQTNNDWQQTITKIILFVVIIDLVVSVIILVNK
jgi:hypothetical protein